MSLFISLHQKASITLEASLVLPLFLFAFISLLSLLSMLKFHGDMEAALHQVGKKMAVYAYASEKISGDGSSLADIAGSIAFSPLYAQKEVMDALVYTTPGFGLVSGGKKGISFLHSKIMKKEQIDLVVSYRLRPLFSLVGTSGIQMANRCRMRAWTGYDNTQQFSHGQTGERMVYVTQSGSVYHASRACTHLTLSIQAAYPDEINEKRNADGGKYHPCERCGKDKGYAVLYLTGQGNRYHTSLHCSGLKRTVFTIPLSQAAGKRACQRCGGG